jgi:transmembrane protein EpsG
MIPYFILLFIIVILSLTISKKVNNKKMSLPIISIIFTLVFFAAIRKVGVGTDSGNYVYLFNDLTYKFQDGFKLIGNIEIGFLFLNYVLLKITDQYWIFFAGISLFIVYLYVLVFRIKSLDLSVSIFIFITSAIYLFSFNGARQGMAAAFVALAILYALDKKIKLFLLFVFLSTLFHKTAIIMLPFYYLINIRFSLLNVFLLLVVSFLPINFLAEILSLADENSIERYSEYIDRGATGGELLTLFFIINNIVLIYFRKEIRIINLNTYDKLLFLANIHTIIYIVVVLTGKDINLARFSIYFSVAFPLIWPILFNDSKTFKTGLSKTIVFIAYLFFYYVYLDKMSNLTPYELNPSLW